jgi:hypothetical protein
VSVGYGWGRKAERAMANTAIRSGGDIALLIASPTSS